MSVYTGFWIQDNRIWGPVQGGRYWIQDGGGERLCEGAAGLSRSSPRRSIGR